MQGKLEEIKAAYGVQTMYIVCDFGKFTKMSEYREIFTKQLADINDIGVAVLNAGWAEAHKVADAPDDYLEQTLNINCIHVYYVAKILSEKLLAREKRSCMIVTSSLAAMYPFPMSVPYSSQKVFVTYLARGMNMEMCHKVDVVSFNPGGVATKLIMKEKSQVGGGVVSTEHAVKCLFRDCGHTDVTYGAFVHDYFSWSMANMPDWMWKGMA